MEKVCKMMSHLRTVDENAVCMTSGGRETEYTLVQ